jgi:hypothetical protein
MEVFVVENAAIGAGADAFLTPCALLRVDDDKSVRPPVYAVFYRTCRHAGSISAVLAHHSPIGHLHMWNIPSDTFIELKPELPGVGLRHGIR